MHGSHYLQIAFKVVLCINFLLSRGAFNDLKLLSVLLHTKVLTPFSHQTRSISQKLTKGFITFLWGDKSAWKSTISIKFPQNNIKRADF